jgi:uncharacterized delta-60 repeat protein
MKTSTLPFILLLISLATAMADAPVDEKWAVQADAADIVHFKRGDVRYRRVLGEMLVVLEKPEQKKGVLTALTGPGAAFAGYTVQDPNNGLWLFLEGPVDVAKKEFDPLLRESNLELARSTPGVACVSPVLAEEGATTRTAMMNEIYVALKPGVDAKTYFGKIFSLVRPLHGFSHLFALRMPNTKYTELVEAIKERAADPQVEWVEPHVILEVEPTSATTDPLFINPGQWELGGGTGVDAVSAWDRTEGANAVIAVLDCGIDLGHEDLSFVDIEQGAAASDGLDNTPQNGWRDDAHGIDFVGYAARKLVNPNDPNLNLAIAPTPKTSQDNHGTFVSGIAAARRNGTPPKGGVGVAPGARIMAVRVFQNNEDGTSSLDPEDVAEGIYYAAGRTRNGQTFGGATTWQSADVISTSLNVGGNYAVIETAVNYALNNGRVRNSTTLGTPFFASSGNYRTYWRTASITVPTNSTDPNYPPIINGEFTLVWEYIKDGSDVNGVPNDAVWVDNITLPGEATLNLEGGLPADFETPVGSTAWVSVPEGSLSANPYKNNAQVRNQALIQYNGEGSRSVRSGFITHNQASRLQVRRTYSDIRGKTITFYYWVNSESPDYFKFRITGPGGYNATFVSNSGPWFGVLNLIYPANYVGTFAVGGYGIYGYRVDYSQYGPVTPSPGLNNISVVAPTSGSMQPLMYFGTIGVVSTDRTGGDGYTSDNYLFNGAGTSASSPSAAGVAALILSYYPNLTRNQVYSRITDNAVPTGFQVVNTSDINPQRQPITGYHYDYGYGRLNAKRAIAQGAVDSTFSLVGSGPNADINVLGEHIHNRTAWTLIGGPFTSVNSLQDKRFLARYYQSQLDTTFSPVLEGAVNAIASQTDNKILVGMSVPPYLKRLNADGTTDSTFAPTLDGSVYAITFDSSGNLLVGGAFGHVNGIYKQKLARFFPNGTLDNSSYWYYLNISGWISASFESGVYAIAPQNDGKIWIGGNFTSIYTNPNTDTRNALARLNNNGSLDTTVPNLNLNGIVRAAALLSDGSIVAAGDFFSNSSTTPTGVARYSSTGSPLWSTTTTSGSNGTVYSILVDANDDITLGGGFTTFNGISQIRIARIHANGVIDPYFDVAQGPNSTVKSLRFYGNKVLAAGSFWMVNGTSQSKLVRLHSK